MKQRAVALILSLVLSLPTSSTTILIQQPPEIVEIDLEGLKDLGINTEKGTSGKPNITWVRFEIPEQVGGRKFSFAAVELYQLKKPITNFIMSEVGIGEKDYVTMQLNPEIVTHIIVAFWFEGHFNYMANIEIESL